MNNPTKELRPVVGVKPDYAYQSLHCDAGDHDLCFWAHKPKTAYSERTRCSCPCHGDAAPCDAEEDTLP